MRLKPIKRIFPVHVSDRDRRKAEPVVVIGFIDVKESDGHCPEGWPFKVLNLAFNGKQESAAFRGVSGLGELPLQLTRPEQRFALYRLAAGELLDLTQGFLARVAFRHGATYAGLDGMTDNEKREIIKKAKNLLAQLGNNQSDGELRTVIQAIIGQLRQVQDSLG